MKKSFQRLTTASTDSSAEELLQSLKSTLLPRKREDKVDAVSKQTKQQK